MAFIVASPGKEVTAEIVRAWSRENMANYKVPRHIEIVDELPVNASGKVTKFILRKQAQKILSTQE
jgi:acyl-coenzyme A synthetase/AMP-(fatty) acid ligase